MPGFEDSLLDSDFGELPKDISLLVSTYVPLPDVKCLTTFPSMKQTVDNEVFWRERLKIHFPHRFSALAGGRGGVDYRVEFEKSCDSEYAWVESKKQKWFTFVKEGDIERLKECDITTKDLVEVRDKNGYDLFYWASKNKCKSVLNYFFELAGGCLLYTSDAADE